MDDSGRDRGRRRTVLVEPLDNIPSFDALGIRLRKRAVARQGPGEGRADGDRDREHPRPAPAGRQCDRERNDVGAGISAVDVLTPAEIFGVADRYGSLEAGKVANVVVWTGDPFDFSTAWSMSTSVGERYRSGVGRRSCWRDTEPSRRNTRGSDLRRAQHAAPYRSLTVGTRRLSTHKDSGSLSIGPARPRVPDILPALRY